MVADIRHVLRSALTRLESQRVTVDRQIAALRTALGDGRGVARGNRKPMSGSARRAIGRRMKAYWAKRRALARKSTASKPAEAKRVTKAADKRAVRKKAASKKARAKKSVVGARAAAESPAKQEKGTA